MIAPIGLAALWLAAALAGLQLAVALREARRADERESVRAVAIVHGAMAVIAAAVLGDAVPVAMLAVAGAAIAWLERALDPRTLAAALGVQAAVGLAGYMALLLFDPPAAGPSAVALRYAGYAGLVVATSFVIGAAVTGGTNPAAMRRARLWMTGGWVLLTLGITVGGYAAYAAPDGDDWQYWLPIRNGAVIAWLVTTALLHRWRWRAGDRTAAIERMTWPIASAAFALAGLIVFARDADVVPRVALALAAGLIVASVVPLREHRRPTDWAAAIAHGGIALALAGVAGEAAFARDTRVALVAGEVARIGPWRVRLDGIAPVIGDGWSALQAQLVATRGDTALALFPQLRSYGLARKEQSAGATRWDGQLIVANGAPDRKGRWRLRLWWKPLTMLIWTGGVLAGLGGLVSLAGGIWQGRRA